MRGGAVVEQSHLATLLTAALSQTRRPALVVAEPAVAQLLAPRAPHEAGAPAEARPVVGYGDDVSLLEVGEPLPGAPPRTVALVVADVVALRTAVSRLPNLRTAREVVCVLLAAEAVVAPAVQPSWPRPTAIEARLVGGGAITRIEFAERLRSAPVFAALARASAPATYAGPEGLRLVFGPGVAAAPVDPTVAATYDARADLPPDVLVAPLVAQMLAQAVGPDAPEPSRPTEPSEPPEPSDPSEPTGLSAQIPANPVTGRAPVVLDTGPTGPPIDEALINPIGFRRDWDTPVVDLDPRARLTPALVAGLRAAQAVRVGPDVDPAVVAGLTMAGVPLLASHHPDGDLAADLEDPLRREEHSVRRRRAALIAHGTAGWRARLGERAGVRVAPYPSVSVVLATRRPDRLAHALEQVRRQRLDLPGADVEVLLAPHGFTPDPAVLEAGADLGSLRVVPAGADVVFGEVLRRASALASGGVIVKFDDDDLYSPDLLTDLLLAQRYSGADVVGSPAEFVYLEPLDVTVRRRGPSECFGTVVAGGALLVDRALLAEIGGWRPVRRHVDAHLLDAARRAGATTYRIHGLGYLLRRTSEGHTWDPGLGYFLTRRTLAAQWRGLRPSALMEI